MRYSKKDLESLLKIISNRTGIPLVLDYNSYYGGYIVYRRDDIEGKTVINFAHGYRMPLREMYHFLDGFVRGLDYLN